MKPPSEPSENTLALSLAILRVSLGGFLLIWALEKFFIPHRTITIWSTFYRIDIGTFIPYTIGTLEAFLALAIIVGFQRRLSYGLGMAFHAISVVATWKQLVDPWGLYLFDRPQHLYLAGVPVLAGFVVLYLLRTADRWTLDGKRRAT